MNTFIGRKFGQYEITGFVGRGGMGTVYRARQASVDREVAIKVLPESLADDPNLLERFRQEARTVAKMEHPHILPLFDYGEQDGLPYLVMRLVEGGSLDSHHSPSQPSSTTWVKSVRPSTMPTPAALSTAT
jgi:serine/threonine-protein kinase